MDAKGARSRVEEQKGWMVQCGDDLAGYRARYGDSDMPYCYGAGGTAIYKADCAWLTHLKKQGEVEPSKPPLSVALTLVEAVLVYLDGKYSIGLVVENLEGVVRTVDLPQQIVQQIVSMAIKNRIVRLEVK